MAIFIKKWNGSAWVNSAVKKWNGSAWVDAYTWRWYGYWDQVYPERLTTTTQTKTGGNMMAHWRPTWNSWKYGDAKQGSGDNWGGSVNCSGCLRFDKSLFPGHGNITEVSAADITCRRGDAGYYNNNQTIYFYRGPSNLCPAPGSSGNTVKTPVMDVGQLTGQFTAQTGGFSQGPGILKMMYNKPISGMGAFKDFMNGASGKPELFIYATARNDYMDIGNNEAITIKATYTYLASRALFVKDGVDARALSSPKAYAEGVYHDMLLYPEEKGLSLNQIITRRKELNIPDIRESDIFGSENVKPYDLDHKVNNDSFEISLYNLNDDHVPEYSYDNIHFKKFKPCEKYDWYKGIHEDGFNKYKDNIFVRIRNTKLDSIEFNKIIEPTILLV